MKTSHKNTTVIYLRVNRRAAESQESANRQLARQRQACQALAERFGLHVVREYQDNGGATPSSSRTDLNRMLDDLATHDDASLVLASDQKRLARLPNDVRGIDTRLKAAGARLMTADNPGQEYLPPMPLLGRRWRRPARPAGGASMEQNS